MGGVVFQSGFTLGTGDPAVTHPMIGYEQLVSSNGSNISATTEDPEYPASNVANFSTAQGWKALTPSPAVDNYLTVITGTAELVDYLGVAGHNFGTAGCTVSVEGQSYASPLPAWVELASTTPTDDEPIVFRWTPQQLYAVRLKVTTGSVPAECGILYVGRLLLMPRSLPTGGRFTPFPFGRRVNAVDGFSQGGSYLGRVIISEHEESEIAFEYLDASWYRTYFDPFVEAAVTRPFFLAWDPSNYPGDLGFAWCPPGSIPQAEVDPITGRHDVTLTMVGVA